MFHTFIVPSFDAKYKKKLRVLVAYLELSRTSTMELFCENSERPLAINYFRKKAPSQMFDWTLNTPLGTLFLTEPVKFR